MRTAVKRCNGHALSLTLLASLLQKRHLSLAALLSDSQLWKGNLAKKLLDDIYQELSDPQRKLLAAFSVYREPVPVEAALAVASDAAITRNQADAAIDTLLAQHLLDAKGDGHYLPHAIVAEYAQRPPRRRRRAGKSPGTAGCPCQSSAILPGTSENDMSPTRAEAEGE